MATTKPKSRNLVLSRIGNGHALQGLLGINQSERTWSLALSAYDEFHAGRHDHVEHLHFHKGGKWDGIYAFFESNPDLLETYDFFWLVDDDIQATARQVEGLFAYMEESRLEIAQPSLTLDSYHAHRLTLQCPVFSHRNTNFVELMMPVFSKTVMKQALPYFKNTRSGLGLDWLWNGFAENPKESIAIIDAIAMPHKRPRNQHLRSRMEKEGISAQEELQNAVRDWGLKRTYPVAFSGKLVNGKIVRNRLAMSYIMTRCYWALRRLIIRRSWSRSRLLFFSLRQAFSRL